MALVYVRLDNIVVQKRFMLGLYIGMMVAFAFTFSQGRLLSKLIS